MDEDDTNGDHELSRLVIMESLTCIVEEPTALGCAPPFALACDPDVEEDMYIGEYPMNASIGRALIFCRTVHGGEDGFEKGRLYVLFRPAADPNGEPVRLPIPRSIDEGVMMTVMRLVENNAAQWGYDPTEV